MTEQPQSEQIPAEMYMAEMEQTIARQSSELVQARTVARYYKDTIGQLQTQNVVLQKRVTELEDAASLPQPG